jgi:hypothetical protein
MYTPTLFDQDVVHDPVPVAASNNRLAPTAAATALAVPRLGLRGAVLHVQRLLNVQSYPVLRIHSDGATVILDVPLMREQFGIETKPGNSRQRLP